MIYRIQDIVSLNKLLWNLTVTLIAVLLRRNSHLTTIQQLLTQFCPLKVQLFGWRLRDWSRPGGSYGNNTRVICCPAPGRPESAALGTSRRRTTNHAGVVAVTPDRTVINPDYNMTKQRCMKRIYDKIHPKSPPNLATSPTCLHCDITHLSLTTGVVALHIQSWRIEVCEERRQARKIVWSVNAGRVICRYQNSLCGIINHHKHITYCFLMYTWRFQA